MRSSPLIRRGSPIALILLGLFFTVTGGLKVMHHHEDAQHFAHPTVTWGRVTDVRIERHRSGRHTHRQVAKAHVSFTSKDGGQHSFWGVTSTTSAPGDRRQVEYDADSPSHARFPGSSQAVSTWDTWSGWIRLGLGILTLAMAGWWWSRHLRSGRSDQPAAPTAGPYQAGPTASPGAAAAPAPQPGPVPPPAPPMPVPPAPQPMQAPPPPSAPNVQSAPNGAGNPDAPGPSNTPPSGGQRAIRLPGQGGTPPSQQSPRH